MPDYQQLIADECDAIKSLLLQKNADYGNAAFEPKRIFSQSDAVEQIKVRIDDKLSRISNQSEKSIDEDTVMDLVGYLVLLRVAQKVCANTPPTDEWWQYVATKYQLTIKETRIPDDWAVEIESRKNGSVVCDAFWASRHNDPYIAARDFITSQSGWNG